jgi:protein-disulfide isomerase
VVAVAIAISAGGGGGGGATGLKTGSASRTLVSQVSRQLAGIPQSGVTLGKPSAPVTMTYYGDLQCPVCRDFTLSGGFPQLLANEVKQGKVKVVYRNFQTATPSQSTFETQQVAALAAGKQNRFWDFVELFYHQQGAEGSGYVTSAFLNGLAQQAGLNMSAWNNARNDSSLGSQVSSDEAAAHTAGIQGTPTLVFKGRKGQAEAPPGVATYNDLQQTIKQVA